MSNNTRAKNREGTHKYLALQAILALFITLERVLPHFFSALKTHHHGFR